MTIFDQNGQTVNYQYNVNGTINFGAVQNRIDVVAELKKLQAEVASASDAGALEAELSTDVEAKIKKAVIQAQKSEPDKKTILSYLEEAKSLMAGVLSAAGLMTGISEAFEAVKRFL